MQLGLAPPQTAWKNYQFITPLPNKSYPEASHQQILPCQPVLAEKLPSQVFAAITIVTDKNPTTNISGSGNGMLNT